MSGNLVPNIVPGNWDQLILKGSTWPATTISMQRDGSTVIPVSAVFTVHDPSGNLELTINASIDGQGVMTIAGLSAAQTAALTFSYGNSLLRVTEGDGTVTDLLAGNTTVVSRAD